jgi:hypothetical protein
VPRLAPGDARIRNVCILRVFLHIPIIRSSYLVACLAPRWFFHAFLMLLLRIYLLPGGKVPVPRFAVYWPLAMRGIECVYFTGVSAHLQHKGLSLVACLPLRLVFLCFSDAFPEVSIMLFLSRGCFLLLLV